MVSAARLYKVLLSLFLIAFNPTLAGAEGTPLHFAGRYAFDWGGIYLGTLTLGIDENPDTYSIQLQVRSGGIVNLFTRHSNDTEAKGRRASGAYLPEHYESHYKTKNKPRHIKLEFDTEGKVTEELNEPPEDRTERPVVPHALKDGSYDPLAGLMMIRAGYSKIRAFDVKRLYEVKAERVAITQPAAFAGNLAIPYILSRKPLGGMTLKETGEYNKGEPPLTFYFSEDTRRIPLGVTMPLPIGRLRGILVKECKTWDECKL